MDWTVHIEIDTDAPINDDELWALAEIGGSVTGTVGDRRLGITATEPGPDGDKALTQAMSRVQVVIRYELVAAEVLSVAEADRRLSEPAFPELAGVSEIANLLGVTRQRASALQTKPAFPAPIASLASGPIWRRDDLTNFADTWSRQVGRPRSQKQEIA